MKKPALFFLLIGLSACVTGRGPAVPKTYPDYHASSGFGANRPDSAMVENLEVLGRVWGFVKYHHPAFADTVFDADCELFGLLPRVARAERSERNRVLAAWIEGLGGFRSVPRTYEGWVKRKNWVSTTGCAWIKDTLRLGASLSGMLQRLRYAERGEEGNRYVRHFPAGNPDFSGERPYVSPWEPDDGYRLLGLYRYWNAVEYFFPYRNLADGDWDGMLRKYIPLVLGGPGRYTEALCALIAETDDSHAGGNLHDRVFGGYRLPVDVSFVEGRPLVTDPWAFAGEDGKPVLRRGDEIVSVNGVTADTVRARVGRYLPYSNGPERLVASLWFAVKEAAPAAVAYVRDSVRRDTIMEPIPARELAGRYLRSKMKKGFRLLDDSVAYLYAGGYREDRAGRIGEALKETKVFIVDLRGYPGEPLLKLIKDCLYPRSLHFANFTVPVLALPGYFYRIDRRRLGRRNDGAYRGRLVVLVDGRTISQAEYTALALQAVPGAVVVGSQTAGTDGDISPLVLPGGLRTAFSGIGVYYPDWTPTQRTGIRVDVPAEPTMVGVRAGRDEVLEKAWEVARQPGRF